MESRTKNFKVIINRGGVNAPNSKFQIPNSSETGFTLIETVIYIALFSIITSFVMVVFYQMLGGRDQHRNRAEVDQEANFMMQKMLWALTGASAINQPTGGATSSALSVNKYGYANNPVVFSVGVNNLQMSKAGGSAVLLGNSRVFVNNLLFTHIASIQGSPAGVKISIKVVSADIVRSSASTTLEHTVYLR